MDKFASSSSAFVFLSERPQTQLIGESPRASGEGGLGCWVETSPISQPVPTLQAHGLVSRPSERTRDGRGAGGSAGHPGHTICYPSGPKLQISSRSPPAHVLGQQDLGWRGPRCRGWECFRNREARFSDLSGVG